MGEFADRMEQVRIQVTSPDGRIAALISGQNSMQLQFKADAYERYTETGLQRQLEALLQDTWRERRAARFQILSQVLDQEVGVREPTSPQERKFREEKSDVIGVGFTDEVEVLVLDECREWQVRLTEGCLEALDSPAFLQHVQAATAEAVQDFRTKVSLLRSQIFQARSYR